MAALQEYRSGNVQDQKTSAFVASSDHDIDSVDLQKEVWDATAVDPVLAKKMALINDAIDEVGMTPWQWKVGFDQRKDHVSTTL